MAEPERIGLDRKGSKPAGTNRTGVGKDAGGPRGASPPWRRRTRPVPGPPLYHLLAIAAQAGPIAEDHLRSPPIASIPATPIPIASAAPPSPPRGPLPRAVRPASAPVAGRLTQLAWKPPGRLGRGCCSASFRVGCPGRRLRRRQLGFSLNYFVTNKTLKIQPNLKTPCQAIHPNPANTRLRRIRPRRAVRRGSRGCPRTVETPCGRARRRRERPGRNPGAGMSRRRRLAKRVFADFDGFDGCVGRDVGWGPAVVLSILILIPRLN